MARVVCSVLWLTVSLIASVGAATTNITLVLLAWAAAFTMLLVTTAVAKPRAEEQLVRPVLYRVVAGGVLAMVLAGAVLALLPNASEQSEVFGVFFGVVAVFAYRAVTAGGPTRALVVAAIASLLWVPFVFATLVGCKFPHHDLPPPHWTETASTYALQLFLFTLPVLLAAALVAFKPRTDALPEARVR